MNSAVDRVRPIAFYLPQFHPVPENDEWWGRGFTEWRNVTQARPRFPGHYQPHLPADLGFYDLRLAEVREAQAQLARQYGIHGFCYYHYWFNGRRILDRPFSEVLAGGKPDFPFCLCWANENWTRVWDGGEKDVLLAQRYGPEDDLAHIRSLIPAFRDERYIRVTGRPLFLVYRTGLLPNPKRTTEVWREEALRAGIGDLYLARVERHGDCTDPESIGFDASIEFAPFESGAKPFSDDESIFYRVLSSLRMYPRGLVDNVIYEYATIAKVMAGRAAPRYKRFHCVSPGWDNTARRKRGATVVIGSTPLLYRQWLAQAVRRTAMEYSGDERLVFINAWNEWAEGNHLEPDLKFGNAYLRATAEALLAPEPAHQASPASSNAVKGRDTHRPDSWKRLYWDLAAFLHGPWRRRLAFVRLPLMYRRNQ